MKNPALGSYELKVAAEFADSLNNMEHAPVSPVELSIQDVDPPVLCTFDYDPDEGFMLTDFAVDDVTETTRDAD